jgi:hypothetical protein
MVQLPTSSGARATPWNDEKTKLSGLNGTKNACLLNFYCVFRMVVRLQFMLDSW